MSNTEMIKELRALTQAGMKDCKDALEEANWDLEKAVDIVKVKGLNVVSGREGKVAADGLIGIYFGTNPSLTKIMVEVNCQTDFVANSQDFNKFVDYTLESIATSHDKKVPFDVASVEAARQELVATTKENVVIRRWWIEESLRSGLPSDVMVFAYLHTNKKIGVLLTLMAPTKEASENPAFVELGNDLAMQIAAMNPSAVSPDRLSADEAARQKTIFETQLAEMKKPQQAWPKILEGKFNKWYTEVCLLNQESVVVPKTSIAQVIKTVGAKLGGEIQVVNFIRCQVGEGIEKKQDNLADEVAKMM